MKIPAIRTTAVSAGANNKYMAYSPILLVADKDTHAGCVPCVRCYGSNR